ncbi:IS5 family transposase [Actinokineospora sp. G85]|uniref:IS5 family transposase n=1 Tax=Actinokineospora sp. G85 TaxID=3406626 RepID=UPI003C73BFE8
MDPHPSRGARQTRRAGPDRLVEDRGGCRRDQGEKRGSITGPSPVDRGKNGSKIHVLVDRAGLPLVVGVSAANVNDHFALPVLVRAIPRVRTPRRARRFRPDKLHADKAYDVRETRKWLINRGIMVRISRKNIDTSTKLGRHRWVVERTLSWLTNHHRRIGTRWEHHGRNYLGFLTLAAALTCFKKLTT